MYIYIYIYIYTFAYTYIPKSHIICICVIVYIYIYIYMCVCLQHSATISSRVDKYRHVLALESIDTSASYHPPVLVVSPLFIGKHPQPPLFVSFLLLTGKKKKNTVHIVAS